MQVSILNNKGEQTGRSLELPDDIFGMEPNEHILYLAVKQYQAAQRQGTHKTKTRAEVHGSSRKLHRQKGTGGSRKGNIRNPLYKGGGAVNGPVPHKYSLKMNRRERDLARISALALKARNNKIVVVEDWNMETPKTKDMAVALNALTGNARKSLYIIPEPDRNLQLSVRNIPGAKAIMLSDMNVYDLMNAQVLVFSESAAQMFNQEEEDETPVTA